MFLLASYSGGFGPNNRMYLQHFMSDDFKARPKFIAR